MIKKVLRKKKPSEKLPTRITNDTVAEHRERVLAGGRKLKYPLQYTRNKLVRNAILISLAGLVALVGLVWLQLYVFKGTSDLAYRITRAIPLPVAKIDGEFVPYSDYLLYHRTTMAFLESQGSATNGAATANDRVQFQEKQALERAVEAAYVRKLAREANITVSDEQVNEVIEQQRAERGLSYDAYVAAISDGLKWTMDEVRQSIRTALLRREVSFNIDSQAAQTAQKVNTALMAGKSLEEVSADFGSAVDYRPAVVVPKDNSDGGLSTAAAKLDVGETSGSIKTSRGDGYYFITRHESNENELSYSYVKVPLTKFQNDFKSIKDSDKTIYYINLD